MPERETLEHFAASGATLAIHLSVHVLEQVVDAALAVLRRRLVRWRSCFARAGRTRASSAARWATSSNASRQNPVDRTATILVGPVLGADDFRESALYSTEYQRRFRPSPSR